MTPPVQPWCGAVLTGGSSRRMGVDTALVPVGGSPLAVRAAAALRQAGAVTVTAIGGDLAGLGRAGLRVRPDDHAGQGPLGAVLTALRGADAPVVVVLACDLLAPDPGAIGRVVRALATAPAALVALPRHGGRLEPLHGAYRHGALEPLTAAFVAGERSVHRALRALAVVEVLDVDPAALADADTPADLDRRGTTLPAMDAPGPPVPEIDVDELAQRREAGIELLDVRQPDEYDEFHVPGALLIPLAEVPQRLAEIPGDGTVHVICRSGARSRKAAAFLRTQGYDAVNVAGGSLAWYESGRPVATGLEPG